MAEELLREVLEVWGLAGNAAKGFSSNLGQIPGLEGEKEELLFLKLKSCCVCAVPGVADVLFLQVRDQPDNFPALHP